VRAGLRVREGPNYFFNLTVRHRGSQAERKRKLKRKGKKVGGRNMDCKRPSEDYHSRRGGSKGGGSKNEKNEGDRGHLPSTEGRRGGGGKRVMKKGVKKKTRELYGKKEIREGGKSIKSKNLKLRGP